MGKMLIKLLYILIILITLVESVYSGQTCENPQSSKMNSTEVLAKFNDGSIALTGNVLYQLLKSNPNTNIVASATSVMIPLAQLAYFATGLVLKQLLKVLNLQNKEQITSIFPGLISDYNNQTQVVLELATQYYFGINYALSDNFKERSSELFGEDGENINFGDSNKAADTINDWVAEKTHDKIKDLVNSQMFNEYTVMVLVNAIYFLGNWVYQFLERDTKPRAFYMNNNQTVQIPIMYQENYYNYCEDYNLQIKALEMPYKNYNFRFLVLLPNDKGVEPLKALAKKLKKPKVFTGIVNKLSYEKVQVYLPRMHILTTIDVAAMLKKDHITEMFKRNNTGLITILERPKPVYISDAVQKAFISVNEKGTEAAAATAIIAGSAAGSISPPPQIYTFKVDHPCIFFLLQNRVPLFCGAFLGQ